MAAFLFTLFRLLLGIAFALLSVPALSPLGAAIGSQKGGGAVLMIAIFAGIVMLIGFAPSIRRAFGRGFLSLGACVFLLPISTLLLSTRVTTDMANEAATGDAGYAVAGGVIAGGLVTGVAMFFGLIVGSLLLLIGLVLSLGGRREVVVVQPSSPSRAAVAHAPAARRIEPPLVSKVKVIDHEPRQVEVQH